MDQVKEGKNKLNVNTAINMLTSYRSSFADYNGLLASQMDLAIAQIQILGRVGALLSNNLEFKRRHTKSSQAKTQNLF